MSQAEAQKRKPHAVRRLVWFSPLLSENCLSFFERCLSISEPCILISQQPPLMLKNSRPPLVERGMPLGKHSASVAELSLKLGIIFEEPFRDLHRIEGSSLFDLVAHQPEGEAIGVGQVFADATHKHVVATFEQEGHGIFAR